MVKYISYWCTECGSEHSYPDCSAMEVYIRCRDCSNLKPVMFIKDKLAVVRCIYNKRMRAILSLCKLTGNKFEDILGKEGPAFTAWIREEELKRRR